MQKEPAPQSKLALELTANEDRAKGREKQNLIISGEKPAKPGKTRKSRRISSRHRGT
jgi:hypothetical protein